MVPLLMEWAVLVSLLAPIAFVERRYVLRNPKLGLTLWFVAFLTAGIAVLSAVLLSGYVAFKTWLELNRHPVGDIFWLKALGISFLPWTFLALGGIALSLANYRLAPQFESAREASNELFLGLRTQFYFEGFPVAILELPVKTAFAMNVSGERQIVVSRGAIDALTHEQLTAVYWHEVGHLIGRHHVLKRIVAFAVTLAPFVSVSEVFANQVELLCELDAHNFALRHASHMALSTAQEIFTF